MCVGGQCGLGQLSLELRIAGAGNQGRLDLPPEAPTGKCVV